MGWFLADAATRRDMRMASGGQRTCGSKNTDLRDEPNYRPEQLNPLGDEPNFRPEQVNLLHDQPCPRLCQSFHRPEEGWQWNAES